MEQKLRSVEAVNYYKELNYKELNYTYVPPTASATATANHSPWLFTVDSIVQSIYLVTLAVSS